MGLGNLSFHRPAFVALVQIEKRRLLQKLFSHSKTIEWNENIISHLQLHLLTIGPVAGTRSKFRMGNLPFRMDVFGIIVENGQGGSLGSSLLVRMQL